MGTTTTLYLPSTAYGTISLVLTARLTDTASNGLQGGSINFLKDGTPLGSSVTNSTGYATFPWTSGVIGTHTITAQFLSGTIGSIGYASSQDQKSLAISQTPTVTMILNPSPTIYSLDLQSYSSTGSPIVFTIATAQLASSGAGNGMPSSIYKPSYTNTSSVPPAVQGYGWTGLNQTITTLTYNSSYTLTQTLNWTRNYYLPACSHPSSQIPPCPLSSFPRNGHLYLNATLAPPSNLYATSTTKLNVAYQTVSGSSSGSNTINLDTSPPAHLYVNVTTTYPFLTMTMKTTPVALANYTYILAYSQGAPPSSSYSSGYTTYSIPHPTDDIRVCADADCSAPASFVAVYLLTSLGATCLTLITDGQGMASVPNTNCSYVSAKIYTLGNTRTLKELFRTERAGQFYTNFQGYGFASYAPLRTGSYFLQVSDNGLGCSFTALYPSQSYPDIQCPIISTTERFLTIEKHPIRGNISPTPGSPTILDNVNATIQLADLATSKPMGNVPFSYTVTQTNPSTNTIASGAAQTNVNGTYVILLGHLTYGNYSIAISYAGNATMAPVASSFTLTIFKAKPTLAFTAYSQVGQQFAGPYYYYQGGPMSNVQLSSGQLYGVAQSFKLQGSTSIMLISATFRLQRQCVPGNCQGLYGAILYMGSNQSNMTASLPTGQPLAVSQSIWDSAFPSTNGQVTFSFGPASYTLQPGTVYEIALYEYTYPVIDLAWIDASSQSLKGGSYFCNYYIWTFTDCSGSNRGNTPVGIPVFITGAVLQAQSSSWAENVPVQTTSYYRLSLVNNQTGTFISTAGLSVSISLNNDLYTSQATDLGGNISLIWRPLVAIQYVMTASLPAQNYYSNATSSVMISVTLHNIVLSLSNDFPNP